VLHGFTSVGSELYVLYHLLSCKSLVFFYVPFDDGLLLKEAALCLLSDLREDDKAVMHTMIQKTMIVA
jgi:hypothetical protein